MLAGYGKSLDNGFVFDDAVLMERDVRLEAPVAWEALVTKPLWIAPEKRPSDAADQMYRPLQLVPLAVSKQWFGGSALPCHLINLTFHFVNSLLVYALLRRFAGGPLPSLLLAALFAVHPALSETVLWVSGISHLGATAAVLLLVLVHARTRPSLGGSMLAAFAYLTAMGFAEAAVLAPLLLVAFDLIARKSLEQSARAVPWADYGFLLPALSVYLTLRYHALGALIPNEPWSNFDAGEIAINAIALLPQYAASYLRNFDLNVYHDVATATGYDDPRFQTGALLALAAFLTFLGTVRDRTAAAFGIAWAAIAMAPYLLARWPWHEVFAQRYTYLPAVGVMLACGGLLQLEREPGRAERWVRTFAGVAAASLIPFLVWIDHDRTADWKSERTVAAADPSRTANESDTQKRIRQQVELLSKNPTSAPSWQRLGLLYLDAGRPPDAVGALREADRRAPGQATTLLNLGYAFDRAGQREDAIATYFRLIENHPGSRDARYNLAVIAYEAGQIRSGRDILAELLALSPKDAAAQKLKATLEALGSAPIGVVPPSSTTHRRCEQANRLATADRVTDAIVKLRTAALLDERSSLPHHYLANLYFRDGKIDLAIAYQRKAIALAPDNTIYRDNLAELERARAGGSAKLDTRFSLGD